MRLLNSALTFLFLSSVVTAVAGCGGTTDPAAGIKPEEMAPAAENLGDNPEYAKQFGGGKKN